MANIDRSGFPLLQLPKKAQKNVCRLMDPLHQLALSTCHKDTKNLVRSSGLKCTSIEASVGSIRIRLNVGFLSLLFSANDEHPGFTCIEASYIEYGGLNNETNNYWTSPLFTVRDWMKHVLSVMNRSNINYMHCDQNDFEFFQQNFVGFGLYHLDITGGSVEDLLQLIKGFPRLINLNVESILPEVDFRKTLISNFGSLEPTWNQKLTLNNLLLCNSVHFESVNNDLTPNDLNRFVKLWMKGSNPRMKYCRVGLKSQDQMVSKNMLLRGTNYQDQTEVRTFITDPYLESELDEKIVRGGYEICKKDGTSATITIGNDAFEMYIWT